MNNIRNRKKKKNKRERFYKTKALARIQTALFVIALNILFFPSLVTYTLQGNNRFTVMLGDTVVGITDSADRAYDLYREARRRVSAGASDEQLIFADYLSVSVQGEEVIYGEIDRDEDIISNMQSLIQGNKVETLGHAYSVKVNDTILNLKSAEEVKQLFQDAINHYDTKGKFEVSLLGDGTRQLNVLNPVISEKNIKEVEDSTALLPESGFEGTITVDMEEIGAQNKEGFDAYEYGIMSVGFSDVIEIVDAYIPSYELTEVEVAKDLLLNEQEIQQIYKVESGDTLSEIAIKVGLPLDEIIALNDELESENSVIRVGQEIIITVPEPSLSVEWTEIAKLEEAYNLPIQYIYNDDWYTNESVTHQQPSAGYHEAVLEIKHIGDTVESKETIYEEVIMEPVAKIIEVGTKIPPTYIKPLSGGRLSSSFGPRKQPTKGASTYHKGIDWATPIGTPIYASCGGTVKSAGWMSGYGYCVVLTHPDGKQTRYGHLSKTAVSAGQSVKQGQVIAYSGNTGISSGPHVHFEILVNGTQVNPLNYLN